MIKNNTDPTTSNTSILTPSSSIGQQLRQAREAHGLTQDAIAKQLFIAKQIVNAIEEDDYRQFAALVYVRGYIAAYAKLLQLDATTLLAAFNVLTGGNTRSNQPLQVLHALKSDSVFEPQRHWLRYIAIAIIGAALTSWIYTRYEQAVTNKAFLTTATTSIPNVTNNNEVSTAIVIPAPNNTKKAPSANSNAEDAHVTTTPSSTQTLPTTATDQPDTSEQD